MFDGDTVIVKAKTNFLAVIISAKPSSTSAITVQALGRRAGYNANEFFRDYSSAYQQVPILQCHWIPSTISQRVIANRIENPHGEDSDEVYIVDETELGMPCDVLVSKIRVPNLEGEEEKEEDH